MSGLPSTTARTTVLSEFDEMMISKSIATREQRLRAKGFTAEQAGRGVPAQCAALVAALRDVAARWSDVRCCQIAALDAIPPSQLGKLPGLFCYRDGALCHSLMGAEAVGAARSGPDLARTLAELGVLAPGAGAGGAVSDHESDDLDSD